ncbi:hypothetical protein HJC23_009708 [Cyclotella cryptica]|uniref:Uncharacterized protein n=1 Tax=Cyclotella cryptica TaxID=29204 RepID=A0ABD3Q933_9STRA
MAQITDSIDMGLSILSQLGHEMPISSTLNDIMPLVKQTLQDLDVHDNVLLSYKKTTDTRHLMAMKCLAKLEMTTAMVDSLLHPIVTCKMIKLTIDYGLSPTAPVGFAYFAGILLKQGEMLAGFRFAKLAMQMLDQVGSKEFAGDVILRSTQVLCFHLPLLSVNEYPVQGQEVALAVGDVSFACGLKLVYCVTMFWAGSNLLTVKNVSAKDSRYMKGQNHLTTYNCLILLYHSILALVGEPINEEVMEDQLTNPFQRITYYFQRMYLSFLLNIDDELRHRAEEFFEFRKVYECKISIWYAMHEFYGGLVSFFMYRETGDTVWLDRGKQCKSALRLWAEHGSSWNFAQKLYLLEAEEHYCQTNLLAAQESYESAISSSRLHKFVNDEALACELAGYFYLQVGMLAASREHLECAHEKYIKWGAMRKVYKIFDFLQQTFECNSANSGTIMMKGHNRDQVL